MSYDTKKHKIRTIWEDQQANSNQIDYATLIQGQKETQIKLSASNNIQFGKIQSFNSEWLPIEVKGAVGIAGEHDYQSISFTVEKTLPEYLIPYARINLAYRRVDGKDIFSGSTICYLTQVCYIRDINASSNLKSVKWSIAFTERRYNQLWSDYEMKLFFTLINPHYITAS